MNNVDVYLNNYSKIYADWINDDITKFEIYLVRKHVKNNGLTKVLDIGAGTGRHISSLALPSIKLYALEKDVNSIDYLNHKFPDLILIESDLQHFIKKNNTDSFDIIYMFFNTFCEIALTYVDGKSVIDSIFNNMLESNGTCILGITDTDDLDSDTVEQFEQKIDFDNLQATIGYKLTSFDKNENIATTIDTLEINDLDQNKLFSLNQINYKKWWKSMEIENIALELSLNLKLEYFDDNIYYILRRSH